MTSECPFFCEITNLETSEIFIYQSFEPNIMTIKWSASNSEIVEETLRTE